MYRNFFAAYGCFLVAKFNKTHIHMQQQNICIQQKYMYSTKKICMQQKNICTQQIEYLCNESIYMDNKTLPRATKIYARQ